MKDISKFTCKLLSSNDFYVITDYERLHLCNKEECLQSSYGSIDRCLSSGCSIGYFMDQMLVGYTLANYTDFTVGYIEKSFVLPSFRGYQIQMNSTEQVLKLLADHGVKDVYTMVSPCNAVSISNLEKLGFKFLRKIMVNGVDRNIMFYSDATDRR